MSVKLMTLEILQYHGQADRSKTTTGIICRLWIYPELYLSFSLKSSQGYYANYY